MTGPDINDAGILFIAVYVGIIASAAALNMIYHWNRREYVATLEVPFGKPLEFHSPDDAPRSFVQYGFVYNWYGSALLNFWVGIFCAGYFYVVVLCWLSYAPLFFAPSFALTFFGSWRGLMAPWLIVFTFTHIIGMALIICWDAIQPRYMTPVVSLRDSTHVMIEEDLPFMTDEGLVDPDAVNTGPMKKLKKRALAVKARFQRATCRTMVPVRIEEDGTRSIEYTCVRYVHSEDDDRFHPTGIVESKPADLLGAFQRGGLTQREADDVMATCGKNEINVYVPGVLESLLREFSDFTYIFNSIGTWSYMVYSSWNIGIFWLLLTATSGIYRSLFIVRPNQRKIHDLAQLRTECKILRGGKWRTMQASEIVLGDVVCVEDGGMKLPCDGAVIAGSLVVDESMLTGEPMPIQKMPVERSQHATVTKKNIAYAGTGCLQSTGPEGGKALMVATAVGALTTRGQLVRMVLFPTSVRFKYNDQLPKVYMIFCVYMVILTVIYLSPLMDLKSWITTYLMVLNTIAMCISPMLPVSMVMGQSVTASRLQVTHKIGCLQPGRIPIAGKISTMVFDKTGTITKDGMDFDSVIAVQNQCFMQQVLLNKQKAPLSSKVSGGKKRTCADLSSVPDTLRHALASCHTVTTMRDGTFVGNHVEVSMVQAAGWIINDQVLTSPDGREGLEVVKKLDFDHCRMTSGVVVRNMQTGSIDVFVKGSYEKVQSISLPGSVPIDYDAKTQKCAKDGFYVLGIAHKSLSAGMTNDQVADMTRDSLEDGLSVCGLLLFRNEMKVDSPEAIRRLRKGAIRSVICTGDNALTGISIGRQCGIVPDGRPVLLGEINRSGELEWRDPDHDSLAPCNVFGGAFSDCNLAVTQAAWRYLHANSSELDELWTRIVVFARMKPEDKVNVVKFFQGQSLVVGMCGDGGNDCGGLRAAHAGLALSDAEASMVSPFATGRDGKSLITVVDLIREGRACLATNLATFQYFVVYGFVLTLIRTLIAIDGALSLGEYVWVTMDVGIGMIMVWTMTQSKPTAELCNYRPTATLLGTRTVGAIVVPILSSLFTLWAVEALLWSKDWYVQLKPLDDLHLLPSQWMLRGDNYDSGAAMITLMLTLANTAYVNTYGGRFRQNVIWNWGVNAVYAAFLFLLFWLLLAPADNLSCVYRVNCDTKHSLSARSLKPLAWFSAGGVGGCFLGPQVMVWQHEMDAAGWKGKESSHADGDYWLPSPAQQCQPPPGWNTTPVDSPLISEFGCVGPNNCFSPTYRWQAALIFIANILVNHLFVKLVLQGPVATSLRRRQVKEDQQIFDQVCTVPQHYDSEHSNSASSDWETSSTD